MGMSASAIIAFGFDLGEELPEAWQDDEFDFEVLQASELGLPHPEEEYSDSVKKIYHAYWDTARELIKSHPVELITHCRSDYSCYFLAVAGTEQTAYSGDPKEIAIARPPEEQIIALRVFCKRHSIEWQEPKWFMFSYYG